MKHSDAELSRILHDGTAEGMPAFAQIGDANIGSVVEFLRRLEGEPAHAASGDGEAEDSERGTARKNMSAPNREIGLINVTQSDSIAKAGKRYSWVSYNGDYTGQRYSSLKQVTPGNARHLAAQWVFHTRESGGLEVTPVVVAGIMFVTSSNDAYALDARTGKMLWHHARPTTHGLIDDSARHHNRGVAILGTRLYMETDNAHLLCLDARTGSVIWDEAYAIGNKNYGATSAPLIVKDKVLVGTSGGDDGVRGFLAAFDAETGKGEVAILDHTRAGRERQRKLARGHVFARWRGDVDARHLRSGPQYAVLGYRQSVSRLRWQRTPRRRPVHEFPAGAGSGYRNAEVVLSVHSAQLV